MMIDVMFWQSRGNVQTIQCSDDDPTNAKLHAYLITTDDILEARCIAPTPSSTPNFHTMQSLRRTAVSTAGKCRTNLPRQPRRFAHDEHGHGHGHDHGVEEPLGVCLFYPTAIALSSAVCADSIAQKAFFWIAVL